MIPESVFSYAKEAAKSLATNIENDLKILMEDYMKEQKHKKEVKKAQENET